ncbi:hypothetical protein [Azospirillum sp. TSO22-1]|uniref:hypothetical protein n=1 Tax=Azospirillum sp. TSO22-1 TaxID=716789 RepID=UPI0011B7FAE7|nr:hypothetical protein [Azospirillum sp. TSO22-1]
MMATRDNSGQGGPDDKKATGPLDRAQNEATEMGRQGMGAAQNRIRAAFEQQSHRAADQIGSVAQALHQAAQQLEEENNGTAARYTVMAADRVEQFADTLRNSTVDDLVGQVESFARRQPEVFLGAAFGVGFLFARFIKSSGERIRMADLMRQQDEQRMGGGGGGGGRARGSYDFSQERQNIGGSYPAGQRSTGGGTGTGQSRPRASSDESGVGNRVNMGSSVRDAAELMAGGSPEPAKIPTARAEPVGGAGTAKAPESKPPESKPLESKP